MSADWNSSAVVVDSSLPEELQDRMTPAGVQLEFEQSQQLYREGERHPYLYLVQSGRFALSRIGRSGRRGTFWIVGQRGTFGLCTAFLGESVSCDCECIEDGTVVRLDSEALAQMIDEDHDIRWAVLSSLSQRLKMHSIALHEERMLPLSVRLGRRLIHACGANDQVELNHSDLADFVGASRYAVGKALRAFQSKGYVKVHYGCIEISDRQGIRRFLSEASDLG
ncbi:MAG: Crp/Fnr family transcriptional regulator [Pseudomonadota bacterium]